MFIQLIEKSINNILLDYTVTKEQHTEISNFLKEQLLIHFGESIVLNQCNFDKTFKNFNLDEYFEKTLDKNLDKFKGVERKIDSYTVLADKIFELFDLNNEKYSKDYINFLNDYLIEYLEEDYDYDEVDEMIKDIQNKNYEISEDKDLLGRFKIGDEFINSISSLTTQFIEDMTLIVVPEKYINCDECGKILLGGYVYLDDITGNSDEVLYFCDEECSCEYISQRYNSNFVECLYE